MSLQLQGRALALGECCLCTPFVWAPGSLLQELQDKGPMRGCATPQDRSLCAFRCGCACVRVLVCVRQGELGWAVWQRRVGHPGPVESSLLYSSEESWLAGSPYTAPWMGAGRRVPFMRKGCAWQWGETWALLSGSPGCEASSSHLLQGQDKLCFPFLDLVVVS